MSTRIAILSDVHVPGPGRFADLFADAVARAKSLNCDQVVLLGDTVELGLPEEYKLVRSIIDPLRFITRPVIGNHELLQGTVADFRAAWMVEPFTADLIENLPVMRFNTAIAAQPESDYFGTVDAAQLTLLNAVLSARADKPAIIFSHHPLANSVRRSDHVNLMIDNSPVVRAHIDRHAPPTLMFTGHTHAQCLYRSGRFANIGCPSLGYWPHAFVVAEIDASGVNFQTHQLIESLEDSPDPQAMDSVYRSANEGDASDRAGTISF